ncbi:MAG: hydrogenase maturation nickel metallochaperone HypA [Chromatiaceae bacterium]|nr:hydrogenase maturation nickel metallochaperone HypA [Chromatiaceae bacterium]MCP5438638.1 hydrogenase maturation nickel metallochaperone HypA [Chromatiaceae bacterium]HPE78613.1 hydrogenase maturation nickel metallochaperone HypA [Gammaproteobacteria bacterium]
MHEMSLCESIMQIIEDEAQRQGFERVIRVRLEIGRLSGVEIEAMRFGFDAVTRDSLADGAELEIIELPGTAWCLPCGCEVEVRQRFDACPQCGSYQLQVVSGDQMQIKDLEVE